MVDRAIRFVLIIILSMAVITPSSINSQQSLRCVSTNPCYDSDLDFPIGEVLEWELANVYINTEFCMVSTLTVTNLTSERPDSLNIPLSFA